MPSSSSVERFRAVDVSDYPDVHQLDEVEAVVWVLLVARERLGVEAMTAAEVADVLTRAMLRRASRQRVACILAASTSLVAAIGRVLPARYHLLRDGENRIRQKASNVLLIDPTSAFTSLMKVDAILSSVRGDVRVCDPYFDDKTLLALTGVPKTSRIRALTHTISDPQQFRRRLQAYQSEYGNLELRVNAAGDLHDRYVIDDMSMWLFGQSLNGIGKKQTFVVSLSSDIREQTALSFDARWASAAVWR